MENLFERLLEMVQSPKFYVPVITIGITILVINASSKLVNKLINRNSNNIEIKRRNTIVSLVENVVKYILIIFACLIILGTWGLDITGLVTGLGVAGVVGGLAIQDALKDIIMGCNIIMDNYFVVGDIITYNDFTGEVIEFGLKNTKIKNVDGTVKVVANRNISEVLNLSQKKSTVSIIVPTSYDESEEKVSKILIKICKMIDKWDVTTEETEYLGIDNLNASSVDYLIRAHCKAGARWDLKRQILALVKREFDKNKIKIPYNQIEVHNG